MHIQLSNVSIHCRELKGVRMKRMTMGSWWGLPPLIWWRKQMPCTKMHVSRRCVILSIHKDGAGGKSTTIPCCTRSQRMSS